MIIRIHAQASDINAKGAFDKVAFNPEHREKHAINGYLDHMAETGSEFSDYATAANYTNLCRELESYRMMYAQRLNAYLEAKRGAASALIAGAHAVNGQTIASGTKAKQLRHDLDIWQHSALDRLRSAYDPALIEQAHNKILLGKGTDEEKFSALAELYGDNLNALKKALATQIEKRGGSPQP